MNQDTSSATPESNEKISFPITYPKSYFDGPLKLQRDEFGLLKNVDYKFSPDGFINWRAMVDSKFLYPNAGWFEARKFEVPTEINELEDAQLLIQLGGIKELARLRGYLGISYELTHVNSNHVVAQCTIDWISNYETPNGCRFESVANATVENTNGFGQKFLETIAENRAFVRAVRNFLNIHIAGADEIDKSKNKVIEIEETKPTTAIINAQSSLERQAINAGFKTFESFRADFLNPLGKNKLYKPSKLPESPWKNYSEIPSEECWVIIPLLKNLK